MPVQLWPWICVCLTPGQPVEPPRVDPEIVPAAAFMARPVGLTDGTLVGRPSTLPQSLPSGSKLPIVDVPPGALPPLLKPLPTPRGPEPLPLDHGFKPPAISPNAEYDQKLLYLPDQVEERPLFVNKPHQPSGKFWLNGGYFYGTTQKDQIPTLLVAGGDSVPVPGLGGIFGTVLGEDVADHHFRSGIQFQAGLWLDHDETFQATGEVFVLEANRASSRLASFGTPSLGRAFIDPATEERRLELVADDGIRAGVAEVSAEMYLIGAQANLRHTLWSRKPAKLDLIGGYRFLRLAESVHVSSDSLLASSDTGLPPGTRVHVLDAFETENVFHGGQIGFSGEYRWNRLFFDITTTVAFGANFQTSTIAGGRQTTLLGAAPIMQTTGLLAGPANVGEVSVEQFAVLPAAEATVGYAITDHWRAFLGYRFAYVSDVARPGQLIDPVVGEGRPVRIDPDSDFWIQGITLGLEMRY